LHNHFSFLKKPFLKVVCFSWGIIVLIFLFVCNIKGILDECLEYHRNPLNKDLGKIIVGQLRKLKLSVS